MLYIDYKSKVLLKYKTARQAKNLPPFLMQPTPANLRSECVHVCQERFDKKDQEILRTFFGPHDTQRAYINTIANFDVDKFRPLLNFITEKTSDTELKNIELLAWLVDFKPRPFDSSYKEPDIETSSGETENINDNIVTNTQGTEVVETKPVEVDTGNKEVQKSGHKHHVFITGLVLFIISIAGYWIYENTDHCMYWADDHYEAVSCNQQINNALIIPADNLRLRYFKKITRPDTISIKALGHIWYSKINNDIEFFTSDGHHPVQLQYQLKPLTKYMIEKHIVKTAVNQ